MYISPKSVESIPERVCHASIIGDPAPLDGERGRATMFAYAGDTPRRHGKSALLPLSLSPSCSLRRGDPCSSFRAHLTALTTWSVCALQGGSVICQQSPQVWLSSLVVELVVRRSLSLVVRVWLSESAGINRHIVGDARAPQERRSDSILASSLALLPAKFGCQTGLELSRKCR
jgi:hypothetical protein